METSRSRLWIGAVLGLLCLYVVGLCSAIESPQFAVVHTESDFEIRLYRNSTWISAPVTSELSFEKATLLGFHRLFQYTQGANLNFTRIPMTVPVVTSIVPGAGPFHSSAFFVSFFLPEKFQADPPVPLHGLHLEPYTWDNHCVAARTFSGFATDDNVVKEATKLAVSLSKTEWANTTSDASLSAYSIAQYDSPFHFIGRKNEVWVDIDVDGCVSNGTASY